MEWNAEMEAAVDDLFRVEHTKRSPRLQTGANCAEPPQLVEGLPEADYHADTASVGAHGLMIVGRSPLHYWQRHLSGEPPDTDTQAATVGRAIHCAVLEPRRFADTYAAMPDVDKRTKEGKAAVAEWGAANAGRIGLRPKDHACAVAVAESVRKSPMASTLLSCEGRQELSGYWTDGETGVRCRMRADFVPHGQLFLVDLKSTENAGARAFARSAWNFGYHVQAAHYVAGWKAITGEVRSFAWAAWEKDPPYASAWYYADDDLLEAGEAERRRLLQVYADCLAKHEWPGYPQQLQPLSPMNWER